ncbi:MAG: GH92 family glycosyl hydrolase [Terracidiphilus sp.]
MRAFLCFLGAVILIYPKSLGFGSTVHAQTKPADLVDPMVGTANEGQTYPAAGVPFAMTQWTPATRDGQLKALAPYYFADTRFHGFRGTHYISGSDTQDYGSVQIMMGRGDPDVAAGAPTAAFSHADQHATPYVYTVKLPAPGIEASVAGTSRCGILRMQFTRGGKSWVLVENFASPGDGEVTVDPSRREILSRSGVRRLYAGSGQPAGFSGYAVVEFDRPFSRGRTWSGKNLPPDKGFPGTRQTSTGAYVYFNLKPGEVVMARIGTSFTSFAEARKNLRAEIPGWNFNQVEQAAAAKWNRALGSIEVSGPLQNRRIFYTALYHTLLFPSIFSDVSGTYPEFGGGASIETLHGRPYYDDYSVWDTFRAVHPLFTIIQPKRDVEMVQSLIDKGEEGGFLPIFPAWNSYTSEMDGDHADAIIADAWMKGLRGFNIERAYALMRKNALESPSPAAYADGKGRRALQPYLKYGYIPLEDHAGEAPHQNEQVSRTLDYAYDDYLVGQIAQSLGKSADTAMFARRGQNYRNVIDPVTGFARGRYADGSWITPFNPAQPASYITEGVPFQFTFFVLQDVPGLIQLEHGDAGLVAKLDALFRRNLYDQGNEPSHQIAYLYDYAGAAPKTQEHVHDVLTLYHDSPEGLPGNDDAGQMSAWYVFSALGFYPVTPGIPVYAIGTPHFARASILLPNGKHFQIVSHGLSPQSFYIRSATLNGKPLERFWLKQSEIVGGGELDLEMSSRPNPAWPASHNDPRGLEP